MPDERVADVFAFIFGEYPTPDQALQFVKVYDEIISQFIDPKTQIPLLDRKKLPLIDPKTKQPLFDPNKERPFDHIIWTPEGRMVPDSFIDWISDPTGANLNKFSGALLPGWNKYAKSEAYAPARDPNTPLTSDQISVLPAKEFAAAMKLRDQTKTAQNPFGTYPTYATVLGEMKAPSLSKLDAQAAFGEALRKQGVLPAKSPEFRKYLSDEFDALWEETSGADPSTWKSISNPAELTQYFVDSFTQFPDQVVAEADFLKKYREQDTTGKEFDTQFQQMLSTGQLPGGENLSPERLDTIKETLRKQYVDAFYRNPLLDANTIGQQIISGGFAQEVARQAAEKDRQAGGGTLYGPGETTGTPVSAFEMAAKEGEAKAREYTRNQKAEEEKAAALAQTGQTVGSPVDYKAGQTLLPSVESTQRATFDELLGKQDLGFKGFIQQQIGTGAESPAFRGIRQGFQQASLDTQAPFNALTQRIRQGGSLSQEETSKVINPETGSFRPPPQQEFADFIGKEFERLRTDYGSLNLGLAEESKARSAKAKIRTIVR